jgi:hypothetical protein
MQQHEFIWMAQKLGIKSQQGAEGITVINLRPQIQIAHNYKKKDQMTVIFTEDQSRFLISSKPQLEEIILLERSNKDLEQILRKYCEDNLEKV